MSSKLKKYIPILELLVSASPHMRRNILKSSDDKLIQLLIECCFNTVIGGVEFSKYRLNKIRKHKEIIRKISDPSIKLENKRKLLVQSGGFFLPVFLTAILPLLQSVLK